MTSNRRSWPIWGPIVATAAVACAGYLRFARDYYYTQQELLALLKVALGLLVLVALVSAALGRGRRRSRLLAAGCYAAALAAVVVLARESPAENRRKNRVYLERLAGIAAAYTNRHGAVPDQFDTAYSEAFTRSGTLLPHRGDADGNGLQYLKLRDRDFSLESESAGVTVIYRHGRIISPAKP